MKNVYLLYPQKIGTIAPEIYGHFTELLDGVFYDGLWVGKDSSVPNIRGFRKDLVEKLRAIHPPVLRWPGGGFAETYNWRDGIGENRPVTRSFWTPYDDRYESNAVGTHEFLDLCEMVGAKPYLAANIASASPLQIRDWMDYCLSPRGTTALAMEREKNGHPEPWDIPFWGIGNESWIAGGNMRAEYYVDVYRRYASMMENVSKDGEFYACGTNADEFSWTHVLAKGLSDAEARINGFAMHHYTGASMKCTEENWYEVMAKARAIEDAIVRNWNIICAHGMQKKLPLVVDEWGCWYSDGEGPCSINNHLFEQQNTMRDAVVAAMTLNIFNHHCDKVRMANIAQMVNCIHSLFLAGGEHCIVTPTYHVYDMFQGHQGAQAIGTLLDDGDSKVEISVSASVKGNRNLITLANLSYSETAEIQMNAVGNQLPEQAELRLLASDDLHAYNSIEEPEAVCVKTCVIDLGKPISLPKGSVAAICF